MKDMMLNNGVAMPMLGLGTWTLRGEACARVVETAIRLGYRLIDTATMYGNEKEVGQGIKASGADRASLFVTTKIYRPDHSYQGAARSIRRSLKDLGLDYLDLVLIHEPYDQAPDMLKAMLEAQQAGLVRALGISNYNAALYDQLVDLCGWVPQVNQVECHVYHAQLVLARHLAARGTVMQAWAPLTEGQRRLAADPVLTDIAAAHGRTPAQIALRYLVQQGIPIAPKAASPAHLQENLQVLDFTLTGEDMDRIGTLDGGRSLFGWY